MARQARMRSRSGYLHVITRGIGKQLLFEDNQDYRYYLTTLKRFTAEQYVAVCAYCLMDNHVHLLLRDEKGNTPLLMKKIGICYARYYNQKYERTGYLFQGRYLSKPIENEANLLRVFWYILTNPQKAGICEASRYCWSSYDDYDNPTSFVDTSIFHKLIGDRNQFRLFMQEKQDVSNLLEPFPLKRDDTWAKQTIHDYLQVDSGTALQSFDRAKRDSALRILKEQGLTIRQIERLTGISHGVVQRA